MKHLLIILIIVAGIFICFWIAIVVGYAHVQHKAANSFLDQECSGVLINISPEDQYDTYNLEIAQANRVKAIRVMTCGRDEFREYIGLKDSIRKEMDSDSIMVIKAGSSESKKFKFPVCLH